MSFHSLARLRAQPSVVITGLGPVSAIGVGREALWQAILEKKHGFGPITLCDSSRSPSKIGAEVKGFNVKDHVDFKMARKLPRVMQFAFAAAALAMRDSGIATSPMDRDRIGVYVGTSIGTMGYGFKMRDRFATSGTAPPSTGFFAFYHSTACMLSAELDLHGPVHTMTTGCNSGVDALGVAMRLIQTGVADAMLVVGSDCELEPELLTALCASDSLVTRYNDDAGRASRPFDRGRDGNVLGEGAGALLLESEEHARARGARIYARVAGYASSGAGQRRQYSHDAPDLDLRPASRAMRAAMAEAGWEPHEVDLINANGSSSVRYDLLEARAFADVFGDALPEINVHSIKSMLGQHGAGSSALQAIVSAMSIASQVVPPTINCEDPDPACGPLRIAADALERRVDRVVLHAIGMGGFYYSAAAFAACA